MKTTDFIKMQIHLRYEDLGLQFIGSVIQLAMENIVVVYDEISGTPDNVTIKVTPTGDNEYNLCFIVEANHSEDE